MTLLVSGSRDGLPPTSEGEQTAACFDLLVAHGDHQVDTAAVALEFPEVN